MAEWQSIETAPKDGTKIDIWGRNLLRHDKKGERIVNVSWGSVSNWMGTERDDWQHGRGEDFEPTHWMPVPNPPSNAEEGSAEPQSIPSNARVRAALAAFQCGDMDWDQQDEELMRLALIAADSLKR